MFDRASILSRVGLLCMVATLGCKPDPVTPTTDPEPAPAPDIGGPTTATPEPEPAPEPDDTVPAEVAPSGDVVAETDGPDADPTPDPGADPTPAPTSVAAAKTTDTAEREPLPKPAHKLSGPKCQQRFAVGDKVKGFRLPSVDGKKTISPNGYRKRVLLLNFWGTWCKPCLKELPEFDRLYRKYRKNGLTLVAVATDEEAEPVQAFIDKHKLRAKVALEGEEAAGAYNRPNFPFSFVVDGTGTIIAAYEFIDDSCMGDLEQVIRDELEKL